MYPNLNLILVSNKILSYIDSLLNLISEASHRQHDMVDEETEPTAKIGAQSSADNEMEDGTQKHTKKTHHTLELTDEEDDPAPRPKKS